MAKQIIQKLVDDIDGRAADLTVEFSLDGVAYTIDLAETNAKKLRNAFAPYVAAGSKVGRSGRSTPGRSGLTTDRTQNKAIRAWAKKAGKDISDRGRISQEIVDEYHARANR
jgi:hypothetical protein